LHLVEVRVAAGVAAQPVRVRIDAEALRGRFGEEDVRRGLDLVLEEPVRQDDVRTGHARPAAYDLPHEAPVVDDQLQAEPQDTPAGTEGHTSCTPDLARAA